MLKSFRFANLNWLYLALAVIVLDQTSKLLISQWLSLGKVVVLVPHYLNIVLAYNPGAAFSFLSDASGWQCWFFSALAVIASVVIIVWLLRLPAKAVWNKVGLALILGGALGNLLDRMLYGHVIDFIQVHYYQYYWPDFNVADSAICIGAVMLIVGMLKVPS